VIARHRRSHWPAVALVAGLALAGSAAAGYTLTRPPKHDYGAIPAAARSARSSPAGRTAAQRQRNPVTVTITRVPVRLQIPAIAVSAPVLPSGVQTGGGLAIPSDPSDIGWWAGGAFPGQPAGAVILVGHIDSAVAGPGALFRLQDVRPGDSVVVTAAGRAYRYRVAALRAYAKTSLPAAAIFGQDVTARLVIVSCGGPFDPATGHYLDNIIAYAVPASS
jgi:hypothetical protein